MNGLLSQMVLASYGGAASYDTDATAVFNAMASMPDATRKGHINTLITALKSAGVWTKLDHFVVCANTAAADGLLDWKNPATPWTAVSSPTFTSDRGYAGDGVASYLVGPVELASLTQYQQNSAHFSAWSRTSAAAVASAYEVGTTGASSSARMTLRSSTNNVAAAVNSGGGTIVSTAGTVADGSGFFLFTRSDASTVNLYRNGSAMPNSPFSQTSTTRAAATPSFGRHNTTYSPREWALMSVGADLTTQQSDYYNAVLAYMTAVGAA